MNLTLIFDLDGTLIDSAPDLHAASNRMLAREDRPSLSLETVRSFIGNGIPTLVDRVMAASDLDKGERDRLIAEFVTDYNARATELTRPYPGVVDALRKFRDLGLRLAICTNKPVGPTETILDDLGLAEFFSAIVGGDSFPERKPDPRGVLSLAQELGGSQALYIGDSEVDAETALRAKLPFFLFTEGYRKTPVEDLQHARSFDDFNVLPRLVEEFAPVSAEEA
ncbi:phosphoglycolate phosphatase [Roseibium sp.]|uniref:phosphoglycolate phosphatase n=1 Tax=Roseibium sp. TaxID=1936156 RepID=UPI003D14E4E0